MTQPDRGEPQVSPTRPRFGELTAGERRGLSLRGRLVLVLLAELGLAANIGVGTAETPHVFVWLFVLLPAMLVLGILVTVQAHHRLPVAWHVVVFLGWAASLMVAPWAASWGDDPAVGETFQGTYATVLAWYAIVAVQVSCLLAVIRPAGTSYITVRKIEQVDGRAGGPSRTTAG